MNATLPEVDPRTERVLREYGILESTPDEPSASRVRPSLRLRFADVAKLAAMLCDAPVALITFVGDDTQWIGARSGADVESTPRSESFCAHAMTGTAPFIVPDAQLDPRFVDNVFVTQPPFVRFYAGAPLRSPEGVALGAVCVLDTKPRDGLSGEQVFGLTTLATQVMAQLESQRGAAWRTRIQNAILDLTAGKGSVGLLFWNLAQVDANTEGPEDGLATIADAAAIRSFLISVQPDDRALVLDAIFESIRSGNDLQIECRAVSRRAGGRRVLLRGRIIGDAIDARRFAGVLTDITDQRAAERASAENENRFRILADSMPQMVWSTRADGFHDYYNARWYDFTGMPVGSTDGQEWSGMFHPDDQELAWERWRHSLASGEPYEIEYRLRHRSGQYRWTLGRALPMRDADDVIVRWFGTCTDIHDAKQAAEERELVAQELSHRIKNTFLVISGLIGLYARNTPAMRPFANEMRDRIAALGRAHNFVRPHSRLSRAGPAPGTLHGLISQLIAPYQSGGTERIVISGDDLEIDDRAATPFALLAHELATNAVKYGALSVPEGTLALNTLTNDDTLTFTWIERGGPPVTNTNPMDGFGTRVSRLSVEAQMAGMLARHWDREGLRVEVQIPIESIAGRATLDTPR